MLWLLHSPRSQCVLVRTSIPTVHTVHTYSKQLHGGSPHLGNWLISDHQPLFATAHLRHSRRANLDHGARAEIKGQWALQTRWLLRCWGLLLSSVRQLQLLRSKCLQNGSGLRLSKLLSVLGSEAKGYNIECANNFFFVSTVSKKIQTIQPSSPIAPSPASSSRNGPRSNMTPALQLIFTV